VGEERVRAEPFPFVGRVRHDVGVHPEAERGRERRAAFGEGVLRIEDDDEIEVGQEVAPALDVGADEDGALHPAERRELAGQIVDGPLQPFPVARPLFRE